MFYVYLKNTGIRKQVLAVSRDNEKTLFLLWEDGKWVWVDAELYEKD